jgi:hypothetical protein
VFTVLFELPQFGQHRIVHRSNPVIFIQIDPANNASLVQNEHPWLGNLSFRIVQVVRVDDLVIGVGQNGKGQLQPVRKVAIPGLIVDADRDYFRALGSELVVVSSQTGQLCSAVGSPVTAVKHQHDFRFACIIHKRDCLPGRGPQAELWGGLTDFGNFGKHNASDEQ